MDSDFTVRPYLEGSFKHEFRMTRARSWWHGQYEHRLPQRWRKLTLWGNVDVGVNFDLSKSTTLGINYAKTLGMDHIDYNHFGMSISGRF